MTLPVVFTANGPSGYNLTNSLRFRSSATAYLSRTPASATNRRTYTWSGWVKRGILSSGERTLFNAGTTLSDTGFLGIRFTSDDKLDVTTGSTDLRQTTQVFRDPSAWYHIVVAMDTTQATGSNRVKVYVNGTQVTAFVTSNDPSLNLDTAINNNVLHEIARTSWNSAGYFDGYLAEVNFIDGQALTPSSFGETSATTGVWIPKKYSGTYGTNGFYLPFTDNSALTTSSNVGLGKDFSGNANYWTTNNISITSGSTYDSMTDVPTLTSATAANYAVLNPLKSNSSTSTYQNGNLQVTFPNAGAGGIATGTMAVSSGKWYWEVIVGGTDGSTQPKLGIISPTVQTETSSSIDVGDLGYAYVRNGNKSILGSVSSYGASFTTNDVIGFALDMDAGTLVCYKNNSSQGTLVSGLSGLFTVGLTAYNGYSETINFGQRPFAYTPPTGFVRLNTFNLPTPTIGATASTIANKYFNAITYTGNGAASSNTTQNITTTFYPDLTWVKGRDSSFFHRLTSTGLTQPNYLSTNSTDAEGSVNDTISALASTYFQVKAAGTGGTNQSGSAYVGWVWNANSGSTVSNTAGSITSTVSANTSAGFSIVTYTGTGANATVGHGLGVAPSMVIVKQRNTAQSWCVWHTSIGSANVLFLNSTSASTSYPTLFNSMSTLNSTVFSIGTDIGTNQNTGTYVAYCFAQIAGYSAFGSYTGNGSSDGTFVFTGFRPRFLIVKRTNDIGSWIMTDSARSTYNVTGELFNANTSGAEFTTSDIKFDYLSNGFKLREVNGAINASGSSYIYMAFAENPFKYANAR